MRAAVRVMQSRTASPAIPSDVGSPGAEGGRMAPAGGQLCPARCGAQGNAVEHGAEPRGQAAPAQNAAGGEQEQGAPSLAEPSHKAFSGCQSTA